MPHYVLLVNWTDQGIRNVRETLQRADQGVLDQLEQKYGTHIEHIYWTVGPYDLITIVQAPDDESVSAMGLALGSLGNLRITTLRAFEREEMANIIERLGPSPDG